jgi:organizing structure protein 2
MLLPPTLFLLSFPYFLPKTASNVRAYASSLEDAYLPSLGAQHAAFNKTVANSSVELRAALRSGVDKAEKTIQEGLKKAEEWSGLKLNTSGKK